MEKNDSESDFTKSCEFHFNPESQLIVFQHNPRMIEILKSLEETDHNIHEQVEAESLKKQIQYLNGLLVVRDSEIEDRDFKIQELSERLLKVYSSKRYQIGHRIVKPIERLLTTLKRN